MLERFGITEQQLPPIAGAYSGRCLVVGSGRCLWDDTAKLGRLDDFDSICVKDAGVYWPRQVTHWYSSHLDQLQTLVPMRSCRARYKNVDHRRPILHTITVSTITTVGSARKGSVRIDHAWPWPGHSSSGLMAVYTAIGLGYDEIICVGMPQDGTGHFYDPPVGKFPGMAFSEFDKEKNKKLWGMAEQTIFKGRVRVVSGNAQVWIEQSRNGTG